MGSARGGRVKPLACERCRRRPPDQPSWSMLTCCPRQCGCGRPAQRSPPPTIHHPPKKSGEPVGHRSGGTRPRRWSSTLRPATRPASGCCSGCGGSTATTPTPALRRPGASRRGCSTPTTYHPRVTPPAGRSCSLTPLGTTRTWRQVFHRSWRCAGCRGGWSSGCTTTGASTGTGAPSSASTSPSTLAPSPATGHRRRAVIGAGGLWGCGGTSAPTAAGTTPATTGGSWPGRSTPAGPCSAGAPAPTPTSRNFTE